MADINVERRRPSIWPWIVGLIVLALLIWAIAEMVDRDELAVDPIEEPVAVPQPEPAPPMDPVPIELEELWPMGEEDRGRMVEVSGAVVGQPTPQGFWVLTDRDRVIFIRTDRPVVTGEFVEVVGSLQPNTEEEFGAWFDDARLREAAAWDVARRMHVQVGTPPERLPRAPEGPPVPRDGAEPGAPDA